MNVGSPGTGLGGLFYALSVIGMVGYELYLTARGRSSIERWKKAGVQLFLVMGMGAVVAAITYGLYKVDADHQSIISISGGGLPISPLVLIFLLFLSVLMIVNLLSLVTIWSRRIPAKEQDARPSL